MDFRTYAQRYTRIAPYHTSFFRGYTGPEQLTLVGDATLVLDILTRRDPYPRMGVFPLPLVDVKKRMLKKMGLVGE